MSKLPQGAVERIALSLYEGLELQALSRPGATALVEMAQQIAEDVAPFFAKEASDAA
jgi:hypothetical protein